MKMDTIFRFGSNRNKPKLDLFRSCSRNFYAMDMGMDMDIDMGMGMGMGMGMDLDMDMDMDLDMDMNIDVNTTRTWTWKWTGFFVSVRTEINRNSICFGLFRETYVMDMGVDMDMAFFLLFWFISNGLWMFRLYRNTETSCFDIKAKQPKQTSGFGYCRN
jgi:hypothetical protein